MSRPAVTTAVDAVTAELRAAILAGRRPPGERLREETLAEQFQVARHTLRAALRALAAERLVLVEPHRGARVAALDGAQLEAMFELRTALEVEAARLLAQRRSCPPWPDEVLRAAADLDRLCAAAGADPSGAQPVDLAAVDAAHLALHHALVAAAGSPRITQVHAGLAAESRLVLLQSRARLGVALMRELHRELLEQLPRGGPDVLRRHLSQGRAYSAASGAGGTRGQEDRA